jgi:hypothetical protein
MLNISVTVKSNLKVSLLFWNRITEKGQYISDFVVYLLQQLLYCVFVMWCLKTTEKLKCLKCYKSYIDFSLCYKNKVFMHLIPLLVNSVEWMFIGFLDILSVRSGRYQITNWICVMGFKARAYIRFKISQIFQIIVKAFFIKIMYVYNRFRYFITWLM